MQHYCIITFAFILSIISIALVCGKSTKYRALSFTLSVFALIFSFIALYQSYPVWNNVQIDGNSIIISVMGIVIAMLIGWQLYNALHLKEDADKVESAKEIIDTLRDKIAELERINKRNLEQTTELQKNLEQIKKKYAGILKTVNNPEYIYIMTDAEDHMIFSIKRDGSIDWSVGIPKPIKEELGKLSKRILTLEQSSIKVEESN